MPIEQLPIERDPEGREYADSVHGVNRFSSPKGNFDVVFTKREHLVYLLRDGPEDMDRVSYAVKFRKKEGGPGSSFTYWLDDDYDKEPTPLPVLFRKFIWSPQEDFAFLPEQIIISAPMNEVRTAVALSRDLKWTVAKVELDASAGIWLNRFDMIGDKHEDCDYSVAVFDGRKGKTRTVKASASPVGFRVKSSDNRTILFKVKDNCWKGCSPELPWERGGKEPAFECAFEMECWQAGSSADNMTKGTCPGGIDPI